MADILLNILWVLTIYSIYDIILAIGYVFRKHHHDIEYHNGYAEYQKGGVREIIPYIGEVWQCKTCDYFRHKPHKSIAEFFK